MPKAKINIVFRYWGGHFKSERQVSQFVTQFEPLVERGWTCHLGLERRPEDASWLSALEAMGVRIDCLPRPLKSFDLHSIRAIERFCRETQCDVFHCDNMHMSPLIGAAWAGVPVRIWCKRAMNSHYEQCREPRWKEKLALTSRLSVLLATRVVAVSSTVANELTDLGMSAGKFHVLNNPRPEMKVPQESRSDVRNRLGIPMEALVFVAVGRVEKVKGWDLLVAAFQAIASDAKSSHLLLVGAQTVNGQESFAAELQERISTSGLTDRVHFTGHVTDIPSLLTAGDIFVLPSRSEGSCNALLEALEAGLPCVATDVGNSCEVLAEGGGILIPRNDARALSEALCSLADNPSKREIFAREARIPDSVCDRKSHALCVTQLYEELLNSAPTR